MEFAEISLDCFRNYYISGDIDINPGPKSNSLNNIFRFATEIRSA